MRRCAACCLGGLGAALRRSLQQEMAAGCRMGAGSSLRPAARKKKNLTRNKRVGQVGEKGRRGGGVFKMAVPGGELTSVLGCVFKNWFLPSEIRDWGNFPELRTITYSWAPDRISPSYTSSSIPLEPFCAAGFLSPMDLGGSAGEEQ